MSLFSVQARKHVVYYEGLLSSSSSTEPVGDSRTSDQNPVSASTKSSSSLQSASRTRLTLQRRSRSRTGPEPGEKTTTEPSQNLTPAPERRPTLQRRTGTPSGRRSGQNHRRGPGSTGQTPRKVLREPNGRTVFRSESLREPGMKSREVVQSKALPSTSSSSSSSSSSSTPGRLQVDHTFKTPTRKKSQDSGGHMERLVHTKAPSSSSSSSASSSTVDHTFKTPTRKTPFQKIAAKRDVFEKLAGRKQVPKSASLERPRPRTQDQVEDQTAGPGPRPRTQDPVEHQTAVLVHPGVSTACPAVFRSWSGQQGGRPTSSQEKGNLIHPPRSSVPAPVPAEPVQSRTSEALGSFKMENSAVTVAVRVRPFNAREKAQKVPQVVSMKGQETVVQHPESRQTYSFTFDLSFCSLDHGAAAFAGQKTVYEKLARPLLLRAFEGFNTCLFAYGQTGSGKSYTMMGFEEEAGVIPRFCQELFSRLTSMENEEVKCRVELSYFEVYNEKIHDLLVTREQPSQRRTPLRVREHPVHGPYVAELSANVVSSYGDIQSWLELGNKQRATAATGMNDKSSRSHSVFTLVMTQTKTEFVEGEEHDHSITSRINLVDLAGSERCNSSQISGDRLREGVSINKSLLTLGKVISALSEQAVSRKKVFIPYRESVLTWLLKESLGGNSKTAMIATVSPAGSNVEESLSTLRYAQQARTIINVAKVNEDTSAKLIRDLKAEVEKLRAAQMNAQGVEPERIRLFQQEVTALKNKLCQQEREMVEANRAWREKLHQAEIHKREETKELQKAGVTFKVDNRLPNLVNLNEDPQLSEMLLYMIREGRTTVGQLQSESSHDIQLTGALIADQHCVISNMKGTVSITPVENAKTFVNGLLVSSSTVLHHGDRVILGGDHYFRFNHPAEVQSGKRVSCWTSAGDGQKDFEFAKNELLAAQRAQLEAEIEEAHLKAKEEMMHGIQMAKEVAQKELSDQKRLYENRIQVLEKELNEEAQKKCQQRLDQQKVASEMAELKTAKLELQQEVQTQKKRLRLHMEAQAMEEHRVCQARIVDALEAEKRKISKELEELQKKRAFRPNHSSQNASLPWDAMKLSVMIEEANKISAKLKKHTVFSRHESSAGENQAVTGAPLQVRVQNTKLGITTFWSLEKFSNNMAAMRDIQQGDSSSKDDDVFYDPDDEWEQDISASSSSTSSFSRRRSRSLLKSRRISGRLYEIRVHPIQSLLSGSSQSAGLMGVPRPPSTRSSSTDPALPGICKELIGQSVSRLRGCGGPEDSMADRLICDLKLVYAAAQSISDLYDGLEDDSPDSVFVCSVAAQTELLKATRAMETAAWVTLQWLAGVQPSSGRLHAIAEELKSQVKKMGAFFQMLIQGCESEITSMVTEARRKSSRCLDAGLVALAHLAAVTGTPLNATRLNTQAAGKDSALSCVLRGTQQGVRSLSEESLAVSRQMLRDAQLASPRRADLQSLKSRSVETARCLQSFMHHHVSKESDPEEEEEEDGGMREEEEFWRLRTTSSRLFQFNQAAQQLQSGLASALQAPHGLPEPGGCGERIRTSARAVERLLSGLTEQESTFSLQTVVPALHAALHALASWTPEEGESRTSAGSVQSSGEETKEQSWTQSAVRSGVVSGMECSVTAGLLSESSPRWV